MLLKQWLSTCIFSTFLLFGALPGQAADQQPAAALKDVANPRAYFDVNVGEGRKLEIRLKLINETFDQIVEGGGQPHFVVGFRGGASRFVTKADGHASSAELSYKKAIDRWLETLHGKGIRLEQCAIAARLLGIEHNDFRPELTLVDNGYLSMIIYQNSGFAQIPMD